MTHKQTQIVILCEDRQQEVFARKYFEARGINRRKITPIICPNGKQSGEQYVREHYAEEVKTFRRKQRENRALVVVIDADTQSVINRLKQLDQHLEADNQPQRMNHERIAIFVPKRNIETWIAFAGGEAVDETMLCRKLEQESDCVRDVQHLATAICPQGLPENAPASLHRACDELKRIL
jgi:dephospho-CoA kinase